MPGAGGTSTWPSWCRWNKYLAKFVNSLCLMQVEQISSHVCVLAVQAPEQAPGQVSETMCLMQVEQISSQVCELAVQAPEQAPGQVSETMCLMQVEQIPSQVCELTVQAPEQAPSQGGSTTTGPCEQWHRGQQRQWCSVQWQTACVHRDSAQSGSGHLAHGRQGSVQQGRPGGT